MSESTNGSPTRITFVLEGQSYRFGAITEDASIPEREIPLDPLLVDRANAELAAETDSAMQLERGRFMERLLVPNDLRPHLSSRAPLVLWLDTTTARIHWEMVAQSDLNPFPRDAREPARADDQDGEASQQVDFEASFLGTSRGLTRQLRTTFSPPPDPPPPPRRLLRVLVVVDPAADAPLKGAQEEGRAVEELFNRFNTVYARLPNRIQVVRLSGPGIATRTNVLRHLMLHGYDVLHFAGHCIYDRKHPASSGWIFTGGERLTANELQRVDRVPKFIVSNACESGQTPDRSGECSAELAPSFAETFFARGVSNFVCTAWSVEDEAALRFARRLYAGLLGLTEGHEGGNVDGSAPPEAMHEAMRAARLAVATEFNGGGSWGAYQHYGNPYFRLFDAPTLGQSQTPSDLEAGDPVGTMPLRRRPRESDPEAA